MYNILECGFWNADFGMRSAECGMRSAECGVRNAECGMPALGCCVKGLGFKKRTSYHFVRALNLVGFFQTYEVLARKNELKLGDIFNAAPFDAALSFF